MSFPEIPLFVYPSLAKRYGVEESLLLYICHQLINESGQVNNHRAVTSVGLSIHKIHISTEKWTSITSLWSRQQLAMLCASLNRQQAMSIETLKDHITIQLLDTGLKEVALKTRSVDLPSASQVVNSTPEIENLSDPEEVQNLSTSLNSSGAQTQKLPVYDVPPAAPARPLPKLNVNHDDLKTVPFKSAINSGNVLKNIGPAPSFGGSTGWKKRSDDELQTIFNQQEVLNKQLNPMTMDWRPSSMLYSTLSRNNIPQDFANGCMDEFILFYCDKNIKERSWDQKFLAWVKRAWVKQQSHQNKLNSTAPQTGLGNENSQRDSREKRKRITAAIMDIHDTNW